MSIFGQFNNPFKMKHLLFLLLFFVVTCLSNAQKPNVVIVLTDDQGYGDLGCHGNPYLKTPNLDLLHSQSVRFTNFHSGTTCAPSRASLMTGKYSNKMGVWHTIINREILNRKEVTMADLFKEAGYTTAIFGKWHLGDNYPYRPQDRGFDEVLIHGGGGVTQTPDYWGNTYLDDTYFHNGKPQKYKGYCTDVWFGEASRFIQNKKQKPFLCYIALNAPHGPYNVPAKYSEPYQNNPKVPNPNFYGMIANIDEQLGLFIQNLKKAGVYENTIFVFMTDNGTAAGVKFDAKGNVEKGFNANMRAIKGSPYEGGHRVPCFIHWPQKQLPTRDNNALTSMIDLLPTLLELCQIQTKQNIAFDGINLASAILKNTTLDNERILITDTQRDAELAKGKSAAVMMNDWRLVNGKELYNLTNDLGQRHDVFAENPAIVQKLQKAYEVWWAQNPPNVNELNRVVVGNPKQTEVCLTSHDFYGKDKMPAWNQQMVRRSEGGNGLWAIEVQKAGRYRIELRRYPKESKLAMSAAAPATQLPPGFENFSQGKSLSIQKAKLKVGDKTFEKPVSPADTSVIFEIDLPAGNHDLQTWLIDANGNECGAFYGYLRRK